MPDTPEKFYLTTPIYYVNARPHIGHAYTTIVADVVARRQRLLGKDVFFLTGTDEHGQKIERSAAAAGIPPQQFADQVAKSFADLWARMGITHNKFIRTTDPAHQRGAQKLFQTLFERGFIELRSYTGTYCVSDEAFVDVPVGTPCPECGRITETITEENFFFKLSEFQAQLVELIESGTLAVEPEARRNEVLSFIRGGLKDLSISRTSFKWGIPVPNNDKHVIYVWLDALTNYMTAIGYGSDARADVAQFEKYWPADLHLVGKEIIRFHCVYWPAFLLAAGLPLPKKIHAHGWLLFEESKMSKSRGNVVRAETILDAFGDEVYGKQFPDSTKAERDLFASDVMRYFLLREIPFGQDGSFSFDALITRYNADLANGYGNLVSRTFNMIESYFSGVMPEFDFVENHTSQESELATRMKLLQVTHSFEDNYNFSNYLLQVASLISATDAYITSEAPWKLAKQDDETSKKRLGRVLRFATESIALVTACINPYMPTSADKIWKQLGFDKSAFEKSDGRKGLPPDLKLGALAPIFPRADKGLAQIMTDMEARNNPSASTTENAAQGTDAPLADNFADVAAKPVAAPDKSVASPSSGSPETPGTIAIDDFIKVDLRVAQIVVAERIPKADKLLRLEVDLGYEKRQILSGIAEWYTPEELIGRRIAVIANLAPRKMRGLESHGMLLAASTDDHASKPVLASFSDDVPLGSRIR